MRKNKKKLLYNKKIVESNSDSDSDIDGEHNSYEYKHGLSSEYYLYSDIKQKNMLKLNKYLKGYIRKYDLFIEKTQSIIKNCEPKPITIYINSDGGYLHSALPIVDIISSSEIPITTVVEGMAASAATLISCSGHHRQITKNSFMLIHELRAGCWGKFSEIEDEFESCQKLMTNIKNLYLNSIKNDKKKKKFKKILGKLLKRDIILSAQECLDYGLVDEILK